MSEARRSSSSFRASASRLSSGRRSSSREPKPILVPKYAVANEESHKGEDFHREEVAEACSAFAVFDGHGGKDFARAAAASDGMLSRFLAQGGTTPAQLSDTAVQDTFWEVDAAIGEELAERGLHGGAVCGVLLVDHAESYACTLAWVGDSTAIVVDMRAKAEYDSGGFLNCGRNALLDATENHSACVAEEKATVERMAAVCKQIRKGAKEAARAAAGMAAAADDGSGSDDEKVSIPGYDGKNFEAPTAEEVAAACAKLGHSASDAEVAHMTRAFARERRIYKAIPKSSKYRRNAYVMARPKEKDQNQPVVVATHADPYSSHYKDLQMTRSLGDWTKSAWVLPHPQLRRFTVPHDESRRVVIASDGLWDIISAEDGAAIARQHDEPQAAADALLAVAQHEYHQVRGLEKMGDDTTVVVVDLNPGGLAYEDPIKGMGGVCCAVL